MTMNHQSDYGYHVPADLEFRDAKVCAARARTCLRIWREHKDEPAYARIPWRKMAREWIAEGKWYRDNAA